MSTERQRIVSGAYCVMPPQRNHDEISWMSIHHNHLLETSQPPPSRNIPAHLTLSNLSSLLCCGWNSRAVPTLSNRPTLQHKQRVLFGEKRRKNLPCK